MENAKEYLQKKYPQMRGHLWNATDIDDNWVAQMMTEFAETHLKAIIEEVKEKAKENQHFPSLINLESIDEVLTNYLNKLK